MKKVIQVSASLLVALLLAQTAQAETPVAPAAAPAAETAPAAAALAGVDAIKASLMTARENLVAMIAAPDATGYDKYLEEIASGSKGVDDGLAAAAADKATTPEQLVTIEAFKTAWADFKKTREEEIIPAVKAGKQADAKELATTIQAERMKTMKGALTALGAQPDPEVKPEVKPEPDAK